jgi:ankyrin repeat protein
MFADDKKNNTEKSGTSQMEDHNSKLEAKENTATGETPYLDAAKQVIVEMRALVKEMKSKTEEKEEIIVTGETPYLVAAKQGIVEIMRELEKEMKSVIHDRNSNNENVMLVAVKYRQPLVVQQLKKELDPDVFESLCTQVDNEGNTMLHLAAFTSPSKETTWKMAGPAMQMTWDIKWYKVHFLYFQ